jgi:hypothetical protein
MNRKAGSDLSPSIFACSFIGAFFLLLSFAPAVIAEDAVTNSETSQPASGAEQVQKGLVGKASLEVGLYEHRVFFNDGAVVFVPNAPLIIIPRLQIADTELLFKFPLQSAGPEGKNVGNSEYFSVQAAQRIKSFQVRGYYERYKSFYIDNFRTPSDEFYVFPDMASKREGAEVTYFIGRQSKDEFYSRNELGPGGTAMMVIGTLGILYDKTVINNVPQSASFPGAAQLPFSDAEFTTLSPKLGLQLLLLGDLDKLGRQVGANGFLELSMDVGYGSTRLSAIDKGTEQSEDLRSTTINFLFDCGLRPKKGNAVVGMKIVSEAILINKKDLEIDAFALLFYGGIAF